MTVAEAAKEYIEASKKIAPLEARKKAARLVLLEWFEKNKNKRDYRGLIGYSETPREILDNEKVRAHLGPRLSKFMKATTVRTLAVLKK